MVVLERRCWLPVLESFWHTNFIRVLFKWVSLLNFLELNGSMLVQKLVNTHVATADPDLNLVFLDTNCHSLGAKIVHALANSHHHDLKLVAIGIVVYKLSNSHVNGIVLSGNINLNFSLQINDVILQHFYFNFWVTHALQKIQTALIGCQSLLLEVYNITCSSFYLILQLTSILVNLLDLITQSMILDSQTLCRLWMLVH